MPLLGESFHAYLRSTAAYRGVGMCTLQAVVMLCFIFDEESFSKMFLSVGARVIRLRLTLGISSAFYY